MLGTLSHVGSHSKSFTFHQGARRRLSQPKSPETNPNSTLALPTLSEVSIVLLTDLDERSICWNRSWCPTSWSLLCNTRYGCWYAGWYAATNSRTWRDPKLVSLC